MTPDKPRASDQSIDDLAASVRRTHEEARIAFDNGDYERAAALSKEAQLLAADIREKIDTLEHHYDRVMLQQAADYYARARNRSARPDRFAWLRHRRRIGATVGTSVGLSLALTEC